MSRTFRTVGSYLKSGGVITVDFDFVRMIIYKVPNFSNRSHPQGGPPSVHSPANDNDAGAACTRPRNLPGGLKLNLKQIFFIAGDRPTPTPDLLQWISGLNCGTSWGGGGVGVAMALQQSESSRLLSEVVVVA